jgi:hypothetical protein
MIYKILLPVAVLLLAGCSPSKDADIVGAAVVAELAQTRNARPADIVVEHVQFAGAGRARVEVVQRVAEVRAAHDIPFACEATKQNAHWQVNCAERQ